MPQLAAAVLTNRDDEEVTFTPRDITNGVATLVSTTGVPVGDKRVSIAHTRVPSSGREKIVVKITDPVVQDVAVLGISRPTVVRAAYIELTFGFDGTSSTFERQDALAYISSLLATNMVMSVVNNLEHLY